MESTPSYFYFFCFFFIISFRKIDSKPIYLSIRAQDRERGKKSNPSRDRQSQMSSALLLLLQCQTNSQSPPFGPIVHRLAMHSHACWYYPSWNSLDQICNPYICRLWDMDSVSIGSSLLVLIVVRNKVPWNGTASKTTCHWSRSTICNTTTGIWIPTYLLASSNLK